LERRHGWVNLSYLTWTMRHLPTGRDHEHFCQAAADLCTGICPATVFGAITSRRAQVRSFCVPSQDLVRRARGVSSAVESRHRHEGYYCHEYRDLV
jgi:hypothetical protein